MKESFNPNIGKKVQEENAKPDIGKKVKNHLEIISRGDPSLPPNYTEQRKQQVVELSRIRHEDPQNAYSKLQEIKDSFSYESSEKKIKKIRNDILKLKNEFSKKNLEELSTEFDDQKIMMFIDFLDKEQQKEFLNKFEDTQLVEFLNEKKDYLKYNMSA